MNLVLVFTPFQYLCATRYANETQEDVHIVVLTSSKTNIQRISILQKQFPVKFPLQRITFIGNNLLWVIKMFYVRCIRIGKYKKILIGNFSNLAAVYLALRFYKSEKEVILLDDGMATLNIYKARNVNNDLSNKDASAGRLTSLFFILFPKLRKVKIESLTFYTLYDLEGIYKPKHDKIIKFSFDNRSVKKSKLDEHLVWFIGQPLVALNIL